MEWLTALFPLRSDCKVFDDFRSLDVSKAFAYFQKLLTLDIKNKEVERFAAHFERSKLDGAALCRLAAADDNSLETALTPRSVDALVASVRGDDNPQQTESAALRFVRIIAKHIRKLHFSYCRAMEQKR